MINTAKYLEDTIAFVTNRDLENLNLDFVFQEQYLNSTDFNYTLNNIEDHLTELYEKTRSLQDIIVYSREFIKQQIQSATNECKEILASIEDNADNLKTKNYISTTVSFEESTGSYADRDNKILPSCAVFDSNLTLSGKENSRLKIKNISHGIGLKPYKHNLEDLKTEDGIYRSFYMLDAPIKDGLKEEITVEFEIPDTINHFNLVTSNCKVSSVKYINTNDTVDHIDKHLNLFQCERSVKAIGFITVTEDYKVTTYHVDQSRIKPNFWDTIKEHEYSKSIGKTSSLTQAQIDEMSGLNAFKSDYDKYVKEVNSWIERRESVMKQNISNGYKDSMPKIDFIVAPESLGVDASLAPKTEEVVNSRSTEIKKNSNDYLYNPDKNIYEQSDNHFIVRNDKYAKTYDKYYPTIENAKYQAGYAEYYSQKGYVDKTGSQVDIYMNIGKSKSYASSITK